MKTHRRIMMLFLTAALAFSACGKDGGVYPAEGGSTAPQTGEPPPSTIRNIHLLDAEEARFLALINDYRGRRGLQPLAISPRLTQAARWMSESMARRNYFQHGDYLGRSPFERMDHFGYFLNRGTRGENIAGGNHDADNTFRQWRNSPGHNANMLKSRYRAIGIARAYNRGSRLDWYWTTDFGSYVDE